MNDYSDNSISVDFSDKEKLDMLENWFQKRAKMSSKAIRLILIPVIAVLLFAAVFVSAYYIAIPQIVSLVFLSLLGTSLIVWVVCLFAGGGILKKVRTGDAIMLRKIRSSGDPAKS